MCRLLGVVSSEPTDYRFSLRDAARSLQHLSTDHPHGWGLAVHGRDRGWEHHRDLAAAHRSAAFADLAESLRGELLIAHVRNATVGAVSGENTHPFRQRQWVFAHNGTIQAVDELRSRSSAARLRAIEGQTDSEVLFAFLLTALDDAEPRTPSRRWSLADGATAREQALVRATATLRKPAMGTSNFLLSDGAQLFAHRHGRSLFTLVRLQGAHLPAGGRASRRAAVLVASEAMTDEPWREVAEGSLLAIAAGSHPEPRYLS